MQLGARTKFSLYYVVLALLAFMAFQEMVLGPMMNPEKEVPYSQFREDLSGGRIGEATIQDERILYTLEEEAGEPDTAL